MTWLWWETKISPLTSSAIFLPVEEGGFFFPQACLLNPLLVIRLLPALSHNGSVIWELCSPPATLSPHWWMHWSEPLFSLSCRGDLTNSFLPAYPTGPISWTQVGGCHGGWILFMEVLVCLVCLCCHDDQSIIQEEPKPSVPWLYLLRCVFFFLSLQLMATTQKNSKVMSAVLVSHHVWSMFASCPVT